MKKLIVAVDGTAGSGKTATFIEVAKKLNYVFIDTGLMYRAFTVYAIDKNINFNSSDEIKELISTFFYRIINNKIYVNDIDVTKRLTTKEVLDNINFITHIPEVRKMMVEQQKQLALANKNHGVIEVGRDITSVVLKDEADLKIYLDSSVETRANRRYEQNLKSGLTDMNYNEIVKSIIQRDEADKNREVGPLVRTNDSWYIDNSNLSLEEVVSIVVKKIKEMENQ